MSGFSKERPMRVAVIGSGPSGVYAAEALVKQNEIPVQVDILDKLPTPYGLVRYGVAPDHLAIKSVTKTLDKTLSSEKVRFLGNVELGKDLSYSDLKQHYDAIIYAVGASGDRKLGIQGEDLEGSLSATEFVAWYNGHPDHASRSMQLAKGVAVVGVGNVALDVSRILLKTHSELASSDIAAHALDALKDSGTRDIWILGRRGAAQASFTTKELREFGDLETAEPVVLQSELPSTEEENALTDSTKKKNVEVLKAFASKEPESKPKRVHIRFLVSPVEIIGENGKVSGIKLEKNKLDAQGNAVGTGSYEVLPVQMVLRSVGYKGVALLDVPFDAKRGVIPTEAGRVEGRLGEYATGWIKRGASGVIGTNRKCAAETVESLLLDVKGNALKPAPLLDNPGIDALLLSRGVDVYTFARWKALDAREINSGEALGRPRLKVTCKEEMLRYA